MRPFTHLFALASFAFLSLCSAACSSSTVPAHSLDAAIDVDGVVPHAVLDFPERDAKAAHDPGDSSCSLDSGNCGSDAPTHATVRGDPRVVDAELTTLEDGSDRIYDVFLARTPDDDAAAPKDARPWSAHATCRVYDASLDTPQPCAYTTKRITITLTPR